MIFSFLEFINEGMNITLISDYIKKISSDIKSISNKISINMEKNHAGYIYMILISNLVESDIIHLKSILSKWDKKISNEEFILSYYINLQSRIQCSIYLKNKYTKRVKPSRYVYHWSNVDERTKDEILINGLKPMPSNKSERWNRPNLEYTPVIFAINNLDMPWGGKYLFRIDTNGLKNSWWYSLNYEYSSGNAIMTYEPIPASHITLIENREYLKLREDGYKKISDEFEKISKYIMKYRGRPSNNYIDADLKKLKKILDENKDFHRNGKKYKLGKGLGVSVSPIDSMIPQKVKIKLENYE